MNKEKGISAVILLVLALAIVVGVGYYMTKLIRMQNAGDQLEMSYTQEDVVTQYDQQKFEPLPESSSTPSEIDNNVVVELDKEINSLEDPGDLSEFEY